MLNLMTKAGCGIDFYNTSLMSAKQGNQWRFPVKCWFKETDIAENFL